MLLGQGLDTVQIHYNVIDIKTLCQKLFFTIIWTGLRIKEIDGTTKC